MTTHDHAETLRRRLNTAKRLRAKYLRKGPRDKHARRGAHDAGDWVRLNRRLLLIEEAMGRAGKP
jgi:hypothetical protein